MKRCMVFLSLCFLFSTAMPAWTDAFRSNGKGGGRWSDPATWEGGKLPTGGSVAILTKDVVEVDAVPGNALACDELTVDSGGLLRVEGTNQIVFTVRKGLNIFGGLMLDLSNTPSARCEFVFPVEANQAPKFLIAERSKVLLKGSPTDAPNVVFRLAAPTNQVAPSISVDITTKTWFESDHVAFEGFTFGVRGVDGSGVKFNERFSLRGCQLVRSPISFYASKKIEIEGNHWREAADWAVYMNGCSAISLRSNTIERVRDRGLLIYASNDLEFLGNRFVHNGEGFHLTTCTDTLLQDNVHETNRIGLLLSNCTRPVVKRCLFRGNSSFHLYAASGAPTDPWRLYDCVFDGQPTDVNTGSIFSKQKTVVEVVNTPRQTFALDQEPGGVAFSAYVDILVTNDRGEPLGRVPLRVLSGDQIVAISRTEAVGSQTGHTPLPSTHRPLVLAWCRYVPGGTTNPPPSCTYTVEADGTHLGYQKQTVPLVVDESFLRADPDKPTKTITIKLAP